MQCNTALLDPTPGPASAKVELLTIGALTSLVGGARRSVGPEHAAEAAPVPYVELGALRAHAALAGGAAPDVDLRALRAHTLLAARAAAAVRAAVEVELRAVPEEAAAARQAASSRVSVELGAEWPDALLIVDRSVSI